MSAGLLVLVVATAAPDGGVLLLRNQERGSTEPRRSTCTRVAVGERLHVDIGQHDMIRRSGDSTIFDVLGANDGTLIIVGIAPGVAYLSASRANDTSFNHCIAVVPATTTTKERPVPKASPGPCEATANDAHQVRSMQLEVGESAEFVYADWQRFTVNDPKLVDVSGKDASHLQLRALAEGSTWLFVCRDHELAAVSVDVAKHR